MEWIKERFGDSFIKSVDDFCKCIAVSAESFIEALVKIGDDVDALLEYKSGYTTLAIMDILDNDAEIREKLQNLITLHGLSILNIFRNFHPNRIYGNKVYVLENIYKDLPEYIPDLIDPKPYVGYSDPKHRLPCKAVRGFKRQNKWNRTRSNPKLR